jgi:hypothetical protein
VAELDRIQPEIVLIEGPADADPILSLAVADDMTPPVAVLAYAPDEPRISAFWPYAVFSPEWQALTWALRHQVPVRFCDLPASMVLADRDEDDGSGGDGSRRSADNDDPIAGLAAAAGYADPERWWDAVVESRRDDESPRSPGETTPRSASPGDIPRPPGPLAGQSVFPALTEAMAALREGREDPLHERRREAHMRQVLRKALKETGGDGPVAVVCGAWHAPALSGEGPSGKLPPASRDTAVLRGTPKRKAALAWVPWTHSRLASASGYGAGITSPGWYHHLFTTPDRTVERWFTRVAGVLRERDLAVSSAHVIEAVRLATALSALRARPLPGLDEVSEATRAVLCEGDDLTAEYVTRALVVGERLGSVPEDSPPVPLEADLRARARRLKLKIDPLDKTLTLDLRREIDRDRSVFCHQLDALGIGWGELTEDLVRNTGTFRESWTLRWRPELVVAIVDAAVWGTTVSSAASARLICDARGAKTLSAVTRAVETVLLAALDDALDPVLRALDARAAADADVTDLMRAVPPLVRAVRYGTVRGTSVLALSVVIDALVTRVCAGLPAAVGGLADDAAAALRQAMDGMNGALSLHAGGPEARGPEAPDPETPSPEADGPEADGPEADGSPAGPAGTGVSGAGTIAAGIAAADARAQWLAALAPLPGRRDVHGLIAGRVTRMLADAGSLPWPEAGARLHAALSAGVPPAGKAAWAEGFLAGGGLLLIHDQDLLSVVDSWVASLGAEDFTEVLPLLRRTFGEYEAGERAGIGRAVRRLVSGSGSGAGPGSRGGAGSGGADSAGDGIDTERAAGAVRTVEAILGGAA